MTRVGTLPVYVSGTKGEAYYARSFALKSKRQRNGRSARLVVQSSLGSAALRGAAARRKTTTSERNRTGQGKIESKKTTTETPPPSEAPVAHLAVQPSVFAPREGREMYVLGASERAKVESHSDFRRRTIEGLSTDRLEAKRDRPPQFRCRLASS